MMILEVDGRLWKWYEDVVLDVLSACLEFCVPGIFQHSAVVTWSNLVLATGLTKGRVVLPRWGLSHASTYIDYILHHFHCIIFQREEAGETNVNLCQAAVAIAVRRHPMAAVLTQQKIRWSHMGTGHPEASHAEAYVSGETARCKVRMEHIIDVYKLIIERYASSNSCWACRLCTRRSC